MKLKIDPDFKNLIPPLSAEEFTQLEENIVSEKRCREAIAIWKGYVVDGHNRYTICQRHRIPFGVVRMNFASKEEALIWIAEHQLGRRNLSDAVRIEIASRRAELIKADRPIIFRKAIADAAGVSEQTVHRYMQLLGCADAEVIEQLRRGEIKIGTAYGQLEVKSRVVKDIEIWSKRYYRVIVRANGILRVYWGVRESKAYEDVGVAVRYLERQLGVVEGFMTLV